MSKKCTILTWVLVFSPLAWAEVPADPIEPAAQAVMQQLQAARPSCLAAQATVPPVQWQRLRTFYEKRHYQPAWDGERARALFEQLQALGDDGLQPEDYLLSGLRQLWSEAQPSPRLQACNDVLASYAYLEALQDLGRGRLDPANVEPIWYAEGSEPVPDQGTLLALATEGLADPAAAFDQARPHFALYRGLRQAYAGLRREQSPAWLPVPGGELLRPGAVDGRVPLLIERLRDEGFLDAGVVSSGNLYDDALVAAVKAYQRRHLLNDDGVLGPATLGELNRTPAQRMDLVRVNLERMRWIAHEVPSDGVLVDIAGAQVSVYRGGERTWQARVQVGRPSRETPILKSRITHLTLNPTWTVPPTILREDKLPELRRDAAGYLAANHMQVIDYQGHPVDPASVDWMRPGALLVRQSAGPHNALGRVAVRFPNPFLVYLHDTPSQRLFDRLPRTFSSGCVRVENVSQLVDQLLADATATQRERIQARWASGETRRADLPKPIPILLAYWTAQVDADGQLNFRPDLYGHDGKILAALNKASQDLRSQAVELPPQDGPV